MPHQAIQALIDNPDNWLSGEVVSSPKQAMGTALTKVPRAAKGLFDSANQYFRFRPQSQKIMDAMFKESNPIFKGLQKAGHFNRFSK